MLYHSTRNRNLTATSAEAVIRGIAPDGGLYIADGIENLGFDYKKTLSMTAKEISEYVLSALLPEFSGNMRNLVNRAYSGKFEDEELTPTVKVGDKYVLELFRGPTSAFKDVALSMLPQLIAESKRLLGIKNKTLILTATSGDTGKAALEGFHDTEGIEIAVFFPHGGVSAVQKAQMVTQIGSNVHVAAVKGNFDDAQTAVKKAFAELSGKLPADLSSANSINIGRLAPQVMYYFKAYADLVNAEEIKAGEKINFCVPTGNFGDILAGYFAKLLGLPVEKFICASNENKVLTDFINTGVYDKRREFKKTSSPSMDILVSSNLERLLYMLSDDTETAGYMKDLSEKGYYKVSDELLKKIQSEFAAGFCDDSRTLDEINRTYTETGYLCDTHTAVAMAVARKFENGCKTVVLSTASPYKFPVSCLKAIGGNAAADEFDVMDALFERTGVPVPAGLATLRDAKVLHGDVIEISEVNAYVTKIANA